MRRNRLPIKPTVLSRRGGARSGWRRCRSVRSGHAARAARQRRLPGTARARQGLPDGFPPIRFAPPGRISSRGFRDAFLALAPKIAKPTVEISDKVRVNLEKFVWSSREKNSERKKQR